MATSPDAVMLKQIEAVESVADDYISELARVYNQLAARLTELLKTADIAETADVALAMSDIQKVLTDSGVYVTGDDMFTEGYQKVMDSSIEVYRKIYGENLQYTDQALQNLEALRTVQSAAYNELWTGFSNTLTRELTSLSFGTTTYSAAAQVLQEELGIIQSQADTIIRTTMSEVHRTSTMLLGEDLEIKKYKYYGPDDKITRPFCREHMDQIKTMDEWKALDNGQIGNAATNGGGYNCRHRLVPVSPI